MTAADDLRDTVLAHLSDPHLPLSEGIAQAGWSAKRLLSLLSWRQSRHRRQRPEILDRVVGDLAAQSPDWIAVTGDLTNLGLPAEYRRARRWLDRIGDPARVMVIPGNHEALVPRAWEAGAELWRPYWQGDDTPDATDVETAFPVLRRRGPLALIGMSSARATPPGQATGAAGDVQITRLAQQLRETRAEGLFRVVMIHHPPLAGTVKARKRLLDAPALCDVLAEEGVELVLHGHSHRSHFQRLDTMDGTAQVIGAPSASSMHHEPAACHFYRIGRAADGWRLEITARRVGPDGQMRTGHSACLHLPRAHAS